MEKSKYSSPHFAEGLQELASIFNCTYFEEKKDFLSEDEGSKTGGSADSRFSGFSRFSQSKRPSGFFGNTTQGTRQKENSHHIETKKQNLPMEFEK